MAGKVENGPEAYHATCGNGVSVMHCRRQSTSFVQPKLVRLPQGADATGEQRGHSIYPRTIIFRSWDGDVPKRDQGIGHWLVGSGPAGPAAASVMSDFGADVVKVEPLAGDPYRALLGGLLAEYPNFFWDQDSRNKRSIAIDFTTAQGRDAIG